MWRRVVTSTCEMRSPTWFVQSHRLVNMTSSSLATIINGHRHLAKSTKVNKQKSSSSSSSLSPSKGSLPPPRVASPVNSGTSQPTTTEPKIHPRQKIAVDISRASHDIEWTPTTLLQHFIRHPAIDERHINSLYVQLRRMKRSQNEDVRATPHWNTLVDATLRHCHEANARGVANYLHSFTVLHLERSEPDMYGTILRLIPSRATEMNGQSVSIAIWSLALSHDRNLHSLQEALDRGNAIAAAANNSHPVSSTSTASTTANTISPDAKTTVTMKQITSALVKRAMTLLETHEQLAVDDRFNDQGLSTLVWGLSYLDRNWLPPTGTRLVLQLAATLAQSIMPTFTSQGLANLAAGYSRVGQVHTQLFTDISKQFLSCVNDGSTIERSMAKIVSYVNLSVFLLHCLFCVLI
jgi:hypothetical protein